MIDVRRLLLSWLRADFCLDSGGELGFCIPVACLISGQQASSLNEHHPWYTSQPLTGPLRKRGGLKLASLTPHTPLNQGGAGQIAQNHLFYIALVCSWSPTTSNSGVKVHPWVCIYIYIYIHIIESVVGSLRPTKTTTTTTATNSTTIRGNSGTRTTRLTTRRTTTTKRLLLLLLLLVLLPRLLIQHSDPQPLQPQQVKIVKKQKGENQNSRTTLTTNRHNQLTCCKQDQNND